MKVYIGPYRDRVNWPFRVNDWYFAKRFGKFNYDYDEKDYTWYDKIVNKALMGLMTPINKYINEPWLDKRPRKINIYIDGYDVWSADHTLALIIHPILVKLKENKHGSPMVDDEDVPEHLRATAADPKENEWDTDDNFFKRWDWVLDEMIWAFEQCADEDKGESQFCSGEIDWSFVKDSDTGYSSMEYGPNHTFKVDREATKAHFDRIKNGHRLFGKYYFALWD